MTDTITTDDQQLFEKCGMCHLFVEANHNATGDPSIAAYVHLHRGDAHDEALGATHDAEPSGEIHTLDYWMANGPMAMIARFDPDTWPSAAPNALSADSTLTIEVLVIRDPDDADLVQIFIDGKEVQPDRELHVDPGRGYSISGWAEYRDEVETDQTLSASFRDAALEAIDTHQDSEFICG